MPLRQRFTHRLLFVAALLLLFEDWLWRRTAAQLRRLSRLPAVGRLEAWLRRRTRWQALGLFAAPLGVVFALKIVAFAALARGHPIAGIGVLVADKLVGTALVARLYQLTQRALVQFGWVRAVEAAVLRTTRRARAWLDRQAGWRRARAFVARWRGGRAARRLRAARRMQRRRDRRFFGGHSG